MHLKHISILLFFIFISNSCFSTPIWGPTGHRALGEIAEKYLKKRVKRKIKKLLNGESLAFVSTYADEIKSDKKYRAFYTWHYINFPFNTNYNDSDKNPKGDLISGIDSCINILKSKNSSKKDKVFYLKMLIHLIGDLHQPLHVGRAEDKGGNSVQVQWFNKGTNLHHVWDIDMIEKWNMSYIELANNTSAVSKSDIKAFQSGSVLDWVYESQKLAISVYNSADSGDNLRYRYSYNHFGTVRKQIQKGGIRLAKILNDIFK